jgi:putative FmdB family regulatory protein
MPLYNFKCVKCEHEFEEYIASTNIDELYCPECMGMAKKQMPAPMGLVKGNYTGKNGYSIVKGVVNVRAPK